MHALMQYRCMAGVFSHTELDNWLHSIATKYMHHMILCSYCSTDPESVCSHSYTAMDPLDMIIVCSQCYDRMRYNTESSKRLRENGCCNSQDQWDKDQQQNSVTTVINASGKYSVIQRLGLSYCIATMPADCLAISKQYPCMHAIMCLQPIHRVHAS